MPLRQTLPLEQSIDLVTFTLKVAGVPVSTQYQVASIVVAKEVNRVPVANLMIYDGDPAAQDFRVSNEETFIPGTEIEITAGYHSSETSIFKGIVLRHSLKIRNDRSPLLILDCRDVFVKMTAARRNHYFYDTTDSEAVASLIGNYGLAHELADTTVQHEALVQYDSSDWDFLVTRMEANGLLCFVESGKLTTKAPDFSGDAVLDAVFGATILEFDADLDARHQYQGIKAKTWDSANQEIAETEAAEPGAEENGNLSADDLAAVLNIAAYDLLAGEELAENELQKLADAKLQKARLSRSRGRVRLQGIAQVKPGDLINIGGVGDRFNGKVFVSGVRHEIRDGNWTTDVQFGLSPEAFARQPDLHSPPAADLLPAIQGLQIGVVTALGDDPEGAQRIRVRLPVISAGEEGIWSRVASLDAGNNRGAFFRPEIGDEVVVGFFNNDPRHPVVVGMLNSSAKPAPLTASDQNDEKGFVTRSGMKMIFNDADKSLKIETPAGKKVTIDEAANLMKLEDENGNSISMDAASVTIESAAAMNLKAGANLTIEAVNITLSPSSNFSLSAGGASLSAGSGSASLSAPSLTLEGSGTATLKGGMVMIN